MDDEADITSILRLGLEKEGFEVDVFNNPLKALNRFKSNYYDAIMLDIRMPVMSGFGLAKEIWAKDDKARICFLSAFQIHEREARLVFPNFKTCCFIKKPIMPTDLAKHVQGHLLACK